MTVFKVKLRNSSGIALVEFAKKTLRGTNRFYIINLFISDRNPSITFSRCKPLRKSIKNTNS